MALRRIFYQIGVIAGGTAFILTLFRALSQEPLDIFKASIRAVCAGIAVVLVSLIIFTVIDKIGGPDADPDNDPENSLDNGLDN